MEVEEANRLHPNPRTTARPRPATFLFCTSQLYMSAIASPRSSELSKNSPSGPTIYSVDHVLGTGQQAGHQAGLGILSAL